MVRNRITLHHVAILLGMVTLFVGHAFVVGTSASYILGLPQWYWAVTGVSVLLYLGVVALIRDLAVDDAPAPGVTDG